MFRDEFTTLERLVRSMASSRWRKLAIMRSVAREPGLDKQIDRLYAAVEPERVCKFSTEEARDWLQALRSLESYVVKVEQAIPFDRKLRPIMRPFRSRFQSIIRLRNATHCGMATLRAHLKERSGSAPESNADDSAEALHANDLVALRVNGWFSPEMEIYDHL